MTKLELMEIEGDIYMDLSLMGLFNVHRLTMLHNDCKTVHMALS